MENIKALIRTIPNYPKEGIMFRDITTLLKDSQGFQKSIKALIKRYKDMKIDYVCGVEARGFIIGGALAYGLKKGFVPIRKKGKLPGKTISQEYTLEYGNDVIEIHHDAIEKGKRVLIVDDLLATGGTVEAVAKLLKEQKAIITGLAFVVELCFLKGKDRLKDFDVYSVIKY